MNRIIRKLLLTVAYLASLYCYTAFSSSDSGNYADLQVETGVTSLSTIGLLSKSAEPLRVLDATTDRIDQASKFN